MAQRLRRYQCAGDSAPHRNRQRPPANGSIERAEHLAQRHAFVETRLSSTNVYRELSLRTCFRLRILRLLSQAVDLEAMAATLGALIVAAYSFVSLEDFGWRVLVLKLTAIDTRIVVFVNSFAQRWWALDAFVHFLTSTTILRGAVVMSPCWFLWFQHPEGATDVQLDERRHILLYTMLICVPGLIATRTLAWLLPHRQRPLYIASLHIRRPLTFDPPGLPSWSSFPSDHAVLFVVIATGVFLVSRRIGLFLYLYTALFILLPRVFLGIHYPTDILAGALLGWGLAYSVRWGRWRSLVIRPALRLLEESPGVFYTCFFFLTYQTAELFGPLREGGALALEILRHWLHLPH